MTLEQAMAIKTLAEYHNMGNVTFTSCEDDTYKIKGLRVLTSEGGVLNYTASSKSFIQAYNFIRGVTQ